jgi:hypothetical protein
MVRLDGTGSFDPDGSISAWTWKDQGGLVISTNSAYNAKLRDGVHIFTLTVNDNNGASGTTQLTVTVEPGQNGRKLTAE